MKSPAIEPKVYKCLKTDLPELQKRIKRITKKLDHHGKKWAFNIISTEPQKVAVYDYTGIRDLSAAQQYTPKPKYVILDVTSYTFDMEPLQIGSYYIVAVLEHGDNGNNIVHIVNDDHKYIAEQYRRAKSTCNHCNHNRFRSITAVLYDGQKYIQVGKSCLQEYTGISCYDIIKGYQDAQSICIEDISITDDGFYPKKSSYHDTISYLASCIHQIKTNGYIKDETKYKAWNAINRYETYAYCVDDAKQVIDFFTSRDFKDNFLYNIKAALSNEYSKQSGFVAYAYAAWQKALENEKEQEEKQTETAKSQFIGSIGDKLTLIVKIMDCFTFESVYGYQYIYLFVDNIGNVYKWVTSAALFRDKDSYQTYNIGDTLTIKGSVKGYDDSRGYNQTVLTRCKVV